MVDKPNDQDQEGPQRPQGEQANQGWRPAETLAQEGADYSQRDVVPLENPIVTQVVKSGHPAFEASEHCSQIIWFVNAVRLSRIGTPLLSNEQVIGTLHLSSKQPNAYCKESLDRLQQIGDEISGTVASELRMQSDRIQADQLNGIYQVSAVPPMGQSFKNIRRLDQAPEKESAEYPKARTGKPSVDAPPRLTNREIEVLHYLADGGRNKDIAAEMTVSRSTVKFHIINLYEKLDVRTRGELIRVATRLGFLTE